MDAAARDLDEAVDDGRLDVVDHPEGDEDVGRTFGFARQKDVQTGEEYDCFGIPEYHSISINDLYFSPAGEFLPGFLPHAWQACEQDFQLYMLISHLLHEYEHASDKRSHEVMDGPLVTPICNLLATQARAYQREIDFIQFLINTAAARGIPPECLDLYETVLEDREAARDNAVKDHNQICG